MEEKQAKAGYGAEHISVLKGLEAVRKRPGMYIGSTGVNGLHHLVYEVVDNSIDEAMAGVCTDIFVTVHEDGSVEVADNGRGIPTAIHPSLGVSSLQVVLTELHAGGKFDNDAYKVSGGLHGVGVSVVNALSKKLIVTVERDGKIFSQSYFRGAPQEPVKIIGDSEKTGTTVRFWPDDEIFEKGAIFSYATLSNRLRELAFLNSGVRILFEDKREGGKKEEFFFEGGLLEFVAYINKGKSPLHDPIFLKRQKDALEFELSLQYTESYTSHVFSFVNNINTIDGGMHLSGFKTALTRVINSYLETIKASQKNGQYKDLHFSSEDVHEGLSAVISVKIPNPQFEGQTKTKLGNPEVKGIVDSLVNAGLTLFFEENPSVARQIIEKASRAARARQAAMKAKELARRKTVFDSLSLPGKLADCSTKDKERSEIFIVEGDSAGGTAKMGRDKEIQAILPLRGKILNVEKARINKVVTSEQIANIVTVLGTGIGEEFTLEKLRYNKVIIMTDSDVDGSHITTLLLTFFYRFTKELIEHGHIYVAMAPLYLVKVGKTKYYCQDEADKEAYLAKVRTEQPGAKITIQRYKGLGEMNAEELWETTMDPDQRYLKQISIGDAIEADRTFSLLMGDEVEPRRLFISEHAKHVVNLDI
ncbi:MAG: DNA topoisomerase (ATP-hydrolyzing) subunit B [Candidatus Woesearchaeota archaeon]|nr:MAG: DNA topoisomerase (ATP-hydrolyzing) subunit B [Candidatus Woesearchaeota archaeon]